MPVVPRLTKTTSTSTGVRRHPHAPAAVHPGAAGLPYTTGEGRLLCREQQAGEVLQQLYEQVCLGLGTAQEMGFYRPVDGWMCVMCQAQERLITYPFRSNMMRRGSRYEKM